MYGRRTPSTLSIKDGSALAHSLTHSLLVFVSLLFRNQMQGLMRGDGMANPLLGEDEGDCEDCMVCSDQKRNVLFLPCGHVTVCQACSGRIKKCLLCKEFVDEKRKVEDCLVCSDNQASVLFKPCNHLIACDACAAIMKKCVECREPVEESVPFRVCCGAKVGNIDKKSNNVAEAALGSTVNTLTDPAAVGKDKSNSDVQKLQEQLNDIKEQVLFVLLK